jgi:short-subunit dehydrogenase
MTATPTTLVSGAASGIGRQLAIALVREGHRVALTDINEGGLEQLVSEHGWQQRADVMTHVLDTRDAAGWQTLVQRVVERFGSLDNMLNVAGFLSVGNLLDVDVPTLDKHIDINVKGVMYATQAGARQMCEQRQGHILNVASIAGICHVPGLAAYCASKHAVRGFSLSVAHELRPHGVYVTVFCPDAVETPMLVLQQDRPEAAMTFGGRRPLTLHEVERAILRAMKQRPLEVIMDVPGTGRALAAKLANMFPKLTAWAERHIRKQGERAQARRRAGGSSA